MEFYEFFIIRVIMIVLIVSLSEHIFLLPKKFFKSSFEGITIIIRAIVALRKRRAVVILRIIMKSLVVLRKILKPFFPLAFR